MSEIEDAPFAGEVVTTELVGQFVPIESLEIRDSLISDLHQLASRLRLGQPVPDSLTERIHGLMIEHEKLRQADR
jgi:hypothetical protein